jgi:hypothetical protein
MPPKWADLVLSSDVPYIKLDILVSDGLDIESDLIASRISISVM